MTMLLLVKKCCVASQRLNESKEIYPAFMTTTRRCVCVRKETGSKKRESRGYATPICRRHYIPRIGRDIPFTITPHAPSVFRRRRAQWIHGVDCLTLFLF